MKGNSSGPGHRLRQLGRPGARRPVLAPRVLRQRPASAPSARSGRDLTNALMARLKDKKRYVTGRCAECRWLDVCGGNFRVRAEALTGDLWAPDPACYLTDAEIS